MKKRTLQNREDISLLVKTFYDAIKNDAELGPIFRHIITDWSNHQELLTNFWESHILHKRSYNGNPVTAHQEVDEKMNYSITSKHFGDWLTIWFSTIDAMFEGENAWIAKNKAQKMSTMLFMNMYTHRKK